MLVKLSQELDRYSCSASCPRQTRGFESIHLNQLLSAADMGLQRKQNGNAMIEIAGAVNRTSDVATARRIPRPSIQQL